MLIYSLPVLSVATVLVLLLQLSCQPETRDTRSVASVAGEEFTWPEIKLTRVVGGASLPTGVFHADDGANRLFLVEQRGYIRIIRDGRILDTPFLDISDRVVCCGEQGLLGLAFPPDYAEKGYFYINYTDLDGNTVVGRYFVTEDPNVADSESEQVVLYVSQPGQHHNGGHLAFGPKDGYLYIGMGDGQRGGDPDNAAQDLSTLLGKILRIDVETGSPLTYTIPASNPFTQTVGARDEIWAYGLRNPWRFGFDQKTGDLYIGDVGEDRREEINFQPGDSAGGENYGWRIMEGTLCFRPADCDPEGLVPPIVEYETRQDGCAVIAGAVYRGWRYQQLQGIFLYGDHCSGRIWGLRYDGEVEGWRNELIKDSHLVITSFATNQEGEVFLTDYYGSAVYWLSTAEIDPIGSLLYFVRMKWFGGP